VKSINELKQNKINRVRIQNFKSIVDITMDLGRVNVIIGANGCGKTNILEAISFASAASQFKFDNEYLGARLRNVPPPFMFSAFDDIEHQDDISITVKEDLEKTYNISNEDDEWMNIPSKMSNDIVKSYIENHSADSILSTLNQLWTICQGKGDSDVELEVPKEILDTLNGLIINPKGSLQNFLIYAPEETKLRTFSDESCILPFGRRGEGLFQHLKQLTENKEADIIQAINEGLFMLDWFDGFNIPKDLLANEYKLSIGDRYLNDSLHFFDQRSANEGFLYLLFYLTLFNSKKTPPFFAIDNIETAFNPKLCTKLTEYLISTAKKNRKQVILTTHSPYVLDGLDLSDDEVRLFVARRDIDGHTLIERIPYHKNRRMPLSDLWMNGLIGGLPDNF